MEFWPAISKTSSGSSAQKGQKKSKATSREAGNWTNYPIVDHGGLTAATLAKTGDCFQWEFAQSQKNSPRVRHAGEAAKIFPHTRPKSISNAGIGLHQRAEQGAKYLRTYHPDVDIGFELIQDELDFDDSIAKSRASYDPYQGNTLSALSYFQNDKRKRGFLLAFPMGDVGRDLNISPVQIRNYSLVFQPRSQPVKTFNTPICQLTTSSPATQLIPRKGHYLAVRTYGEVSVFDIKSQYATASKPASHPITLSEIFTIRPAVDTKGTIVDMYLSTSSPAELYAASDQGIVYHCTQKGERKIIKSVYIQPEHGNEDFWRICTDNTPCGGIVSSTKLVKRFDSRFAAKSIDLLTLADHRNVITSICPSEIDHIYCVGTTSEVLWIDDRFPMHPLLGWKHHRRFDRSLSVESIGLDNTSLAVLSSKHNNVSTVISVKKGIDQPIQVEMSSQALPQILHGLPAVGRTFIRHPRLPGPVDSFSMFEMCEQGSVHHREFEYPRAPNPRGQEEEPDSFFQYQWSDDVVALDVKSKTLKPDYGTMGAREYVQLDLSDLYESLFGEETGNIRAEIEDQNPDAVYETLDRMSSFWQHSENAGDHMHTLYDIAFGSGENPLHEARADFLTGSALDSTRGYRARRQGKLPARNVQSKAAWHANALDYLKRLAPNDFGDLDNVFNTEKLDLYEVVREEENPVADHKETMAREQLALDLALSMDVYSPTTIKSKLPGQGQVSAQATELEQEPSALLTKATEQLSLSQKEPPPVSFSYLRPVNKDGKSHYKERTPVPEPLTEEEDQDVEMPLGVRLLLSEWTVGDNPREYNYVDPYDLDGTEAQSQFHLQLQAERRGRMRRAATEDSNDATQRPTQSQAPPTIVAAKTLASTQPVKVPTIARSKTQIQPTFGSSQLTLVNETPSSQPLMMNTQVLPGPFGGRPAATAKKKPVKKRIGGF